MHIPVCVEGFDLLKNFPESSIFDPNIPFKIPTESVNITPDKHAPLKKYLRTNQSPFMN